MTFSPLGDELKKFFSKNAPLQRQIEASFVVDTAQEVLIELIGEESKNMAKPLFLKNRTLTISCFSSVMAQELRLKQPDIVKAINDKLGSKEVDSIRYFL